MLIAKKFFSPLTAIGAVALVALATGPVLQDPEGHPAVGAWLTTVEFPPGVFQTSVATLHADGTFMLSHDTNDFSGGFVHETTTHGVWRPTGPGSMAFKALIFQFDSTGTHVGTLKVRATAELSGSRPPHRGDVLISTLLVDVYPLSRDPLSDPPIATIGPLVATARRITPPLSRALSRSAWILANSSLVPMRACERLASLSTVSLVMGSHWSDFRTPFAESWLMRSMTA